MTQVEMVQLWKEVTGNKNLNVEFVDNYLICENISMGDITTLFRYYKGNDLYLIYREHYLQQGSEAKTRSVRMRAENFNSFENNGKRWKLSK